MILRILILITLTFSFNTYADLALTPPMGWNSWNTFACDIDEKLIKETADIMASNGMKEAGYVYINIDDCWQTVRDEKGIIVVDKKRFPSGMKALADYVHSKGLKIGTYSSAGTKTCEYRAASLGYEVQDAQTYADWGFDYLKYDFCFTHKDVRSYKKVDKEETKAKYKAMADALMSTGRDIVFSICNWGVVKPWEWGKEVGGHLWRTTGDIKPTWRSWTKILDQQVGLEKYAGPGAWNDPDMLIVGMIPHNQSIAHMSLWSLLAAPLIAGNDLRNMSKETLEILTNKEVLAVNQDKLGIQGKRYIKNRSREVWAKPLEDGSYAIVLFNRGLTSKFIKFNWSDLGLDWKWAKVRDLWKKYDLGVYNETYGERIKGRSVQMIRVWGN